MAKRTTTKRRLKPLPKMILEIVRVVLFVVVSIYLFTYLFCVGVCVNAEQMDNRYQYAEINNGLF